MNSLLERMGMRRATGAERAARGLPPYDAEREYAEHLARQAEWAEEQAAKARDDNNPAIAAQRAESTRAADAARSGAHFKNPRVVCERYARTVSQRKWVELLDRVFVPLKRR
jgi:hypothetical protein